MKSKLLGFVLAVCALSLSSGVFAKEYDILKDGGYGCCGGLLGPGSFVMRNATGQFSLGMVNRFIPTYEHDWDFGMRDALVEGRRLAGDGDGVAGSSWGAIHFMEGGLVSNDYIRNEFNMFFNWLSNDGRASFHAHAAYDNLLDIQSGDSGGKVGQGSSDFGIERLNGSMALTDTLRLHAGFEFVDIDTVGGAALMFGDDTAALWLVGKPNDKMWFNIGYHVFNERNKLSRPSTETFAACSGNIAGIPDAGGLACDSSDNDDREAVMGFADIALANGNLRLMYTYDTESNAAVADLNAALNGNALNSGFARESDFDVHHFGAYWNASWGNINTHLGAYYNTGEADLSGAGALANFATGAATDDSFDVNAYAFSGAISLQATDKLNLRLDAIYTSGDDDGDDDDLEGFVCVMCDQRFSAWGGENTFVGDGNFMLGLPVFSHLPEALGNGTPVKVGGIANFNGAFSGGAGRGDNPGYWEASAVATMQIKPHIKFKSRLRYMRWNEEFYVSRWHVGQDVDAGIQGTPIGDPTGVTATGFVEVDEEDIGWEWSNQLDWGLTPNTTIKTQASVFFPGDGVEELIEAYTGEEEDEEAVRLAMEFVWAF